MKFYRAPMNIENLALIIDHLKNDSIQKDKVLKKNVQYSNFNAQFSTVVGISICPVMNIENCVLIIDHLKRTTLSKKTKF